MNPCTCGHDGLSHAGGGACMTTDCDCTVLAHEDVVDVSEWLASLRESQELHASSRALHASWSAEREAAVVGLLRLAALLAAVAVPVLLFLACWVVLSP